jgi:CIC family chloride channel protein
MSAFFTAVVRAPLTGIVLVAELTNSVAVLLPMLAASFTAMAVAEAMRVAPVYDALGERAARRRGGSK